MNATLSRKLRFSDVVYAIDTTPKSLRLWLQRDLVKIHTPKPEGGGWTEYSFQDVGVLALTRTLANFGVDVTQASEFANGIMGDSFLSNSRFLQHPENMPAGALAAPWVNRRLYLYRQGDEWRAAVADLWVSDLDIDRLLPSAIAELRREHEPAAAFLSIDVEAVLRTAFDRANESVNDGAGDAE